MLTAALLAVLSGSLSEEVQGFMDEYRFSGYTVLWSRGLYLPLNEPVTLWIYPPPGHTGVLCGAGGETVYDLYMELSGPFGIIRDEYPDDLPVLEFQTGESVEVLTVMVNARDMLYGATADSAYVFFALKPVPQEPENTNPAQPEQ
jgi:hypothetical protein